MRDIWIIADNLSWLAVLAAGARALDPGAKVSAFIKDDEAAAREAIFYGANKAYALPLPENAMWESYVPVLAQKAAVEKPAVILLSSSKRCRDVAAQLGALLKAPCYSDAGKLSFTDVGVSGETLIYGGAGFTVSTSAAPTVLATLAAKTHEPLQVDRARSGEVETLAPIAGPAVVTGRSSGKSAGVNLDDAEKVVSVGRGVSERGDLTLIQELADALGAELACSRPIAEFFKWLPEDRYIGISGQHIRPKLYLALGISGQAQHYYGVRDAKVIVSVNKDEAALFNQKADYFIVGDWKEVAPGIIQTLAAK